MKQHVCQRLPSSRLNLGRPHSLEQRTDCSIAVLLRLQGRHLIKPQLEAPPQTSPQNDSVPLPEEFNVQLEARHFTQRGADIKMVKNLYSSSLIYVSPRVHLWLEIITGQVL